MISIVTPHHNNFDGLKGIYTCLLKQTVADWEWVIVDDFSNEETRQNLQDWYGQLEDNRVKLHFNLQKTNASVCRNRGADHASHTLLVFLDSDDFISETFIENRHIPVQDFVVFGKNAVIDENGKTHEKIPNTNDYLNSFLSAQFIWPITAILWNKAFFDAIGQFHPSLPRLQDVEIAIRALQISENHQVLKDNQTDFFYHVIPIRKRKHFVKTVCEAVFLFISELLDVSKLDTYQKSLLKGYYYLCTRYLERSGEVVGTVLVRKNLNLFYKKKYIGFSHYMLGRLFLQCYTNRLISGTLFLKLNRYIFKPTLK